MRLRVDERYLRLWLDSTHTDATVRDAVVARLCELLARCVTHVPAVVETARCPLGVTAGGRLVPFFDDDMQRLTLRAPDLVDTAFNASPADLELEPVAAPRFDPELSQALWRIQRDRPSEPARRLLEALADEHALGVRPEPAQTLSAEPDDADESQPHALASCDD